MTPHERVRSILGELADPPADDAAPLDLDSLTLVQLVEALEDAWGVRIAAREVTRDNFGSIDALVAFLARKS